MLETCVVQQVIELALEDPRCRRSVVIIRHEEIVLVTAALIPLNTSELMVD
jgi:hypothetical protein